MRTRRLPRVVLAAVLALSAWLLLRPAGGGEPLPVDDTVLHGALFALLALLGHWTGWPRVAVLTGLAAWALASELLQQGMGLGRTGDPLDLLADLLGLALGTAVGLAVDRLRSVRRAGPGRGSSASR
ncbi:VanZ family protein [Desertihabitans aurantiacus]|uniref:VanZ family protein n=1 Tax=Desertihabitans aurantiacus TaxID=2282477 RepID=UPI0018E52A69|nr:VanZ family protein [Desertihabitans aurantiacus]